MTSDAILVISFVFRTIWRIFNSWFIPGTHTTPAAFAMFSLTLLLTVKVVRMIFNSDVLDGDDDK